jgi:hypothetical protein
MRDLLLCAKHLFVAAMVVATSGNITTFCDRSGRMTERSIVSARRL